VAGNIIKASFQQRYCPPDLLGRLTASTAFLSYGTIPLGALLGGALGTVLGIRTAMAITTAGVRLPHSSCSSPRSGAPETCRPRGGQRVVPSRRRIPTTNRLYLVTEHGRAWVSVTPRGGMEIPSVRERAERSAGWPVSPLLLRDSEGRSGTCSLIALVVACVST